MKILNEFRTFVLRGNVIDLAVGVVIGAAFGKLVDGVVTGIIQPTVLLLTGKGDPAAIYLGTIALGGAVLNFLILAAVVFFVFVKPVNKLRELSDKKPAPAPAGPTTEQLLTEIRDLLKSQHNSPPTV